ncbi:MAG: hypothetical protein JWM47_29 [Acidimicrobiales bacterium]|nr:hypothetical protein [Acidimicrobiales bacterium]
MSHRGRTSALAAALVLASVVGVSQPASAAPGDLDGTWGTGGVRAGLSGSPEAVAEAPDGKVVVATSEFGESNGTARIRRYSATGVLDTSFSGDGLITLTTPTGVSPQVFVDPAGRTVVAASYFGSGDRYQVWRFEADGDPDPTFSGDGTVTLSTQVAGFAHVMGIGRQPDGDLIVGVNDSFAVGGISQSPTIVRLTDGGTVAQSVDVLGDYTESRRGGLASLAVDGTGRPYVSIPDDGKLNVRRFTAALAVDTTYSGDGLVSVGRPGGGTDNENWGGALAVDSAGVALVAGTVGLFTDNGAMPPTEVEQATLLARLTAGGTLDTAFSGDGIVALARPSGSITANLVDFGAAGSAVVVADRYLEETSTSSGLIWQVRSNGAPETGFSGDGRAERTGSFGGGDVVAQGARQLLLQYGFSDSNGTTDVVAIQLVVPAAATVPGAPGTPAAVPGDGEATVSWTAPASNGGSPITGYAITPYIGAEAQPVRNVGPSPTSAAVTGLTNGVAYTFKVAAKNAVGTGPQSAASPAITPEASSLPDGAVYVPVSPCRVVDTRGAGGAFTAGERRNFQVAGTGSQFALQGGTSGGCGIPGGAAGVEASVTAVSPGSNGFFRAWPNGIAEPNATFLNFTKGQGITNTGAITLAPAGQLDLAVKTSGAAHYVIDIQGYFVAPDAVPAGASGAVYVPVSPCRVVDTRKAVGAFAPSTQRDYQVAGTGGGFAAQGGAAGGCGIPGGARAVEASVTAVSPSANGFFRAWPAGTTAPNATFLNFTKLQSITNTGAISLAATGTQDLTVKNFGATTHYVIDIQGYYTSGP